MLTPAPAPSAAPASDTSAPPQASDRSLATAPVAGSVATPERAAPTPPARAPVQTAPPARPKTFASNAALIVSAGILVGGLLGALLARRWFLKRAPTIDAVAPKSIDGVPADAPLSGPVVGTPPAVRFVARLDQGETSIEFPAPADLETDHDSAEMTADRTGDVHA